jgi:hypothetical protein
MRTPDEHGAHAIAKDLGGKSAGAVSNALVDAGYGRADHGVPQAFRACPVRVTCTLAS